MALATGSTLYSHGENTRTCPHSRTLAPTCWPASKTSGSMPREARCAAAASPTGPAPITATMCGFSVMDGLLDKHRNLSMPHRNSGSPSHQVSSICSGHAHAPPARLVLRPAGEPGAQRRGGSRARAGVQGPRRPPPREDAQPPTGEPRRGRLRLRLPGHARPQAVLGLLPPQAALGRRDRAAREARLLCVLLAHRRGARARPVAARRTGARRLERARGLLAAALNGRAAQVDPHGSVVVAAHAPVGAEQADEIESESAATFA